MPISLAPLSRRRFLGTGLAAALFGRSALGADKQVDPHRIFLLSDLHIARDRAKAERGTVMYNNMKQVCDELVAMESRPACVLINGDCAHHTGETGDYAVLLDLLKPLRENGMPVHLSMGNHDQRERFWQAFTENEVPRAAVEGRHITVVKAPRANIFMLDSLDKTNLSPGLIGDKQLAWLAASLDAAADKPAIVMS